MSLKILVPAFYVDGDDASKKKCKKCGRQVSMGSCDPKKQTRMNLVSHLQRKDHFAVHQDYLKMLSYHDAEKVSATSSKAEEKEKLEQTLVQAFGRRSKYEPGTPNYNRVHDAVTEMIAIDCLPFNVSAGKGFRRLASILSEGRVSLLTGKAYGERLDRLYEKAAERLRTILNQSETYKSGTTDIWSDVGSGVSLLSLTVSILHQGKRKKICLGPVSLSESHTGSCIKRKLRELLKEWIPESHIVALTHDSGRNMVKGLAELELETGIMSIRCAQHTQQLVIQDGLAAQPGFESAIAKCKSIAGHFSRSLESQRKLNELRLTLGKPVLSYKSYTETRWDSTWDLVERVLELREEAAILAIRKEIRLPSELSDKEIELLKLLAGTLKLFRSTTKELSKDSASLSLILPFVQTLRERCSPSMDSAGISLWKLKKTMLTSLDTRFGDQCRSVRLKVATFLDPRFRSQGLTAEDFQIVKAEIIRIFTLLPMEEKNEKRNDHPVKEEGGGSPPKVLRKDSEQSVSIWDWLHQPQPSTSNESATYPSAVGDLETQIEKYTNEKPIKVRDLDPAEWWASNSTFSRLRHIGLFFSIISPSSVQSEQLFSAAGQVYSDRRKRLDGEKAAN